MTKISNATLVAAATDSMKMPTGEVGDLALNVGQIKINVLTAAAALFDPAGAGPYWKVAGTTTITANANISAGGEGGLIIDYDGSLYGGEKNPLLHRGDGTFAGDYAVIHPAKYTSGIYNGKYFAVIDVFNTGASVYSYLYLDHLFATIGIDAAKVEISPSGTLITIGVTTPAIVVSSETASRIAHFDANKNVKALDTATYPTLAELAFIKGLRAKPSRTILYKNNVQASNGGSTSEVIVDSFLVPGGTMGANDQVYIDLFFSKSAQNNTFSTTLYVNTSASLVGATQLATYNAGATIRYQRLVRTMWFRNSVSAQSMFSTTATASIDDYLSSSAVLTSLTIDFSTDKYFIIAIDGGASDTCYIETSLFEIIRN